MNPAARRIDDDPLDHRVLVDAGLGVLDGLRGVREDEEVRVVRGVCRSLPVRAQDDPG